MNGDGLSRSKKIRSLKFEGYRGFKAIKVRKTWKAYEVHAENGDHQTIISTAENLNHAYNKLIEIIEE